MAKDYTTPAPASTSAEIYRQRVDEALLVLRSRSPGIHAHVFVARTDEEECHDSGVTLSRLQAAELRDALDDYLCEPLRSTDTMIAVTEAAFGMIRTVDDLRFFLDRLAVDFDRDGEILIPGLTGQYASGATDQEIAADRLVADELRQMLDATEVVERPERPEPGTGVEILPLLLATMEKTGGCPAEIAEDLSARVEIGRRKYGQPLRTNNGDATADKIRKAAIQLCLYLQKAHEEGHGSEAQLYAAVAALRTLYPEQAHTVERATNREPMPHGTGREIVPLLLATITAHRFRQPRIAKVWIGGKFPDRLKRDLLARRAYGIQEYGEPLRADNGRDVLTDALQEALDLCVYLQQGVEQGLDWGSVLDKAIDTLLALYSASSDELWASELLTASADITAEGAVAVLTQRPVAGDEPEPEDWACELASFFLSMKTDNTDDYMEAAAKLLDLYCAATSPHQRVKIATHQTGGAYMVLREDMEPRTRGRLYRCPEHGDQAADS